MRFGYLLFFCILVVLGLGMKGDGEAKGRVESFHDKLVFRGIAASDGAHHVWGCSPVVGEHGKYHLFGARYGGDFNKGWRTDSHIAHFVSDTAVGPFKFKEVVYRGERKRVGEWNYFGIHNPTVKRVDGKFVLLFIANSFKGKTYGPENQSIGMMVSDSVNGPWSKPKQVLKASEDPKHWTFGSRNGVANPAFLKGVNGKYYLYFKARHVDGGIKYGVAISDTLSGPFVMVDKPVTSNNHTVEDGYAFLYKGRICVLTTDNHGIIEEGGGLLWCSDDGIKFDKPMKGFGALGQYIKRADYPKARGVYTSSWKIERPQILMVDGKPKYLYGPCGMSLTGRKYTDNLVFEIK